MLGAARDAAGWALGSLAGGVGGMGFFSFVPVAALAASLGIHAGILLKEP